jgi:hypothetical protein
MSNTLHVYPSPEGYRKEMLSLDAIDMAVTNSLRLQSPLLLAIAMGVGKTFAIESYICSERWRDRCAGVIVFLNSHDQLDEVEERLRKNLVLHPDSQIINIASGLGFKKHRQGNRQTITNFVADFIASNFAAGMTTLVVGRKDLDGGCKFATEAIADLTKALAKRGLPTVRMINAKSSDLPKEPSPGVIPYLTYGATGVNTFEHYESAVFMGGFYVPEEALLDIVFADTAPSKRPKCSIECKSVVERGVRVLRRRVKWHQPVDAERRRFAAAVLRRLELDPVLQAFGRIRYTIHARTVIMTSAHDVLPYVGRVTEVSDITSARSLLGLGDTHSERHKHQMTGLRALLGSGQTLKEAASLVGISYATAKRLISRSGIDPAQSTPQRAQSHSNDY